MTHQNVNERPCLKTVGWWAVNDDACGCLPISTLRCPHPPIQPPTPPQHMHPTQTQIKNVHERLHFSYKKIHFLCHGGRLIYSINNAMTWEKKMLKWPSPMFLTVVILTVKGSFRKLISFSSCLLSVYLVHILCDPMGKFWTNAGENPIGLHRMWTGPGLSYLRLEK